VTTSPEDLSVAVTYDGASVPPTYPGVYDVRATVEDADYAGAVSGRLEVTVTALVRHAPTMNGDVDGSVQLLLPENVTLNSGAGITGDLLVPGAPALRRNGSGSFGGTREGPGAATPTGYQVTLNSGTVLRYLVRRVDAIAVPVVPAPQRPAGTRHLALNSPGQSIGNVATLRDLTLNSKAGEVAVPPGAYGVFTANGSSTLVLGSAAVAEPAVYHLQALTLNSGARLRLLGPVVIRLGGDLVVNGTLGTPGQSLVVESPTASATFNSGGRGDAVLVLPNGTVTLNGATVRGRVTADRLVLNSNALLDEAP
jgi:rhamnogalacturonan endolyase